MKFSNYLIPTLKENPGDAETKSHRLMLRAGLIRKLASGTYSYLPLGLRALKKCENIVREEMDKAGALEVLLPAIHPAEIWKESGRYEILGEDMIHFVDRHGKQNVLGPTHEEIITDLARKEIKSYRQLPLVLYQIQTKFRDEMRPRAGVMRSREFCMKDAYSFHENDACLDSTYEKMAEAYDRIFKRCGLKFYRVQADPGAMGGSGSQEFVLFSNAGEDQMAQFGDTELVMSAEMAARKLKGLNLEAATEQGGFVDRLTPNVSSIEAVASLLKAKPKQFVKTLFFSAEDSKTKAPKLIAVLVRGDHEVSEYKLRQKFPGAHLASREAIETAGSCFGFSGPIDLADTTIPFLIDEDVLEMKKMIVGANKQDHHLLGVQLGDLKENLTGRHEIGDFRQVVNGDIGLVDGKEETIQIKTAIELGHIFKLKTRYSEPLKAHVVGESGKEEPVIMGCYGIGVNRLVASAIEQCADESGIKWPSLEVAPFAITIISTHMQDEACQRVSQELANSLQVKSLDVLWDDRDVSAGIKFNDADLIGIPLRVTIGPRGLKKGVVEIKDVNSGNVQELVVAEALPHLVKRIAESILYRD